MGAITIITHTKIDTHWMQGIELVVQMSNEGLRGRGEGGITAAEGGVLSSLAGSPPLEESRQCQYLQGKEGKEKESQV